MKISVNHRRKKIPIDVKRTGFITKGTGLMFRGKETKNLLFEFNEDTKASITSVFCFFPFLAVWLDSDNKVVETRIVRPFRFILRPDKRFRKLVEIPVNRRNSELIEFLVGGKKFK